RLPALGLRRARPRLPRRVGCRPQTQVHGRKRPAALWTGAAPLVMTKYVICPAAEVPPNQRKIVEVAGRSIGIFNINGEYYALRNSCPHQGGPLCTGRVSGFLFSHVPGEYTYTRRGEILRCPWHGWEFDI